MLQVYKKLQIVGQHLDVTGTYKLCMFAITDFMGQVRLLRILLITSLFETEATSHWFYFAFTLTICLFK